MHITYDVLYALIRNLEFRFSKENLEFANLINNFLRLNIDYIMPLIFFT